MLRQLGCVYLWSEPVFSSLFITTELRFFLSTWVISVKENVETIDSRLTLQLLSFYLYFPSTQIETSSYFIQMISSQFCSLLLIEKKKSVSMTWLLVHNRKDPVHSLEGVKDQEGSMCCIARVSSGSFLLLSTVFLIQFKCFYLQQALEKQLCPQSWPPGRLGPLQVGRNGAWLLSTGKQSKFTELLLISLKVPSLAPQQAI